MNDSGTKERILDAALSVFARKGYDAAGVQEIAETAVITKPTLYYYFGNKEGLFRSLWEIHAAPFFRDFTTACRYDPHPAVYDQDVFPQLCRIANVWIAFADRDPLFVRMMLSLQFSPPLSEAFSLTADILERRITVLEVFFTEVSRSHGNMSGKERQLARSFLALIDNLVSDRLHAVDDEKKSAEVPIAALVKQFMHGIFSL
jgi:TetR/AcrR family transcriptional regulator